MILHQSNVKRSVWVEESTSDVKQFFELLQLHPWSELILQNLTKVSVMSLTHLNR